MKTTTFPSVLESYNSSLLNVTTDTIDAIKIKHNDEDYIIGNLALAEGKSPHKGINSSPDDLDYQLLLRAGLLIAADDVGTKPISITTGFPHSTYNLNKEAASELISKIKSVTRDTRPFGGNGYEEVPINIERINLIPEIFGAIVAAREGEMGIRGSMFVVSLGYGTLEFGLTTEDGFVQRTLSSGNGLRYAIDSAMKELSNTHYLGLRNEHQFDTALKQGNIILNRKRIDLSDLRKSVLRQYYENVISPLIKNTWNDDDFSKTSTLVLVGGGAYYRELVESFYDEFKGLLKIEIPDNPMEMASTGYCLHASQKIEYPGTRAVGLDIGNAHTCVSVKSSEE